MIARPDRIASGTASRTPWRDNLIELALDEPALPRELAVRFTASPTARAISSHNGSSYIAGDLAKWLNDRHIKHLHGAPYHPMTQGKIER
jgi:putative transposase